MIHEIVLEEYPLLAEERFAGVGADVLEIATALSLTAHDTRLLLSRACQYPVATSVLLQLLKHNEQAPDADAFWAESLAYSTLQAGEEFKRWLGARVKPVASAAAAAESPLKMSRENNRLLLQFHRPAQRNAYSAALRDALYEALLLLVADNSIERCCISGAGDCFSVGGDLDEFGTCGDPAQAHLVRMARPVASLMRQQRQRIECHVHRACIGSGIELPAAAGWLSADTNTFFQLPELSMGLLPGAGGTVTILRRIGRHRLAWWVISGKKINAQTALEWGLVDQLVV